MLRIAPYIAMLVQQSSRVVFFVDDETLFYELISTLSMMCILWPIPVALMCV